MRARLIKSAVIGAALSAILTAVINLVFPMPSSSIAKAESVANDSGLGAYFSLVEKGSVTKYLNILADETHHFVATSSPVSGAEVSVFLVPNPNEQLVLAEFHGGATEKLKGELRRFGNFAVLSLPYNTDLHLIDGNQTVYGEVLAAFEQEAPAETLRRPLNRTFYFKASDDLRGAKVNIDQDFLLDRLKTLSGEQRAIVDGRELFIRERRQSDSKQHARDWLRAEYEALGFSVKEESYEGLSFTGSANFVAEKVGQDPGRVLVLSSHLDSVGNAGADDNASGTVAALAIAKALKDRNLKVTLRIVAFDEEEIGLVGSRSYVSALRARGEVKQIIGAVNLEMLAYQSRSNGAFHVIDCHENDSDQLSQVFRDIASSDKELGLRPESACTNRSDHASFWRAGIPAVVVSENFFGGDGNPCYHRSCDQLSRVNLSYFMRMTTLVARAISVLTSY